MIDTHPSPDIRVISALASADFLLSPIQLNQEAIDGVRALLHHQQVGFHKIKAVPTPFQKANFVGIVQRHAPLMIALGDRPGDYARMPKRSCIAEAQADGLLLWAMKKTAARDAWVEIEPTLRRIGQIVTGEAASDAVPAGRV